jgi:hypothetical protein
MRDVIYVAITAGFFALCAAYVSACGRIIGREPVDGASGVGGTAATGDEPAHRPGTRA